MSLYPKDLVLQGAKRYVSELNQKHEKINKALKIAEDRINLLEACYKKYGDNNIFLNGTGIENDIVLKGCVPTKSRITIQSEKYRIDVGAKYYIWDIELGSALYCEPAYLDNPLVRFRKPSKSLTIENYTDCRYPHLSNDVINGVERQIRKLIVDNLNVITITDESFNRDKWMSLVNFK